MATMYYRPYTSQPIKDGEMPPHDALENLLPEYQYIFVDPQPGKYGAGGGGGRGKVPTLGSRVPEDNDQVSHSLMEHQMRELEKYRMAVHRMGEDILALREQIRELEAANSKLRLELANRNDATRLLVDSQELDGLTRPELAARYVSIKHALQQHSADLMDYKDRVQRLQNELIKKNDKEKEYLRVSKAHQSQQELLQRLQDRAAKVKRLEATVQKQQDVIEKQERQLLHSNRHGHVDTHDVLNEANRRLRDELQDVREHNRQLAETHDKQQEKTLKLYEETERQNSRIRSLEQQLTDNARNWAQEKAELNARIQNAEWDYENKRPEQPKIFYYYKPHKVYPSLDSVRSAMSLVDLSHDYEEEGSPRRYSKASRPVRPLPSIRNTGRSHTLKH